MFRLKTPTLVDYSDVLSPSVVEVAHVLQDDVGLTLLKRPPPSQLNRMQVSKSRDVFPTTGHVSDVQKPDSTSESKFQLQRFIFNFDRSIQFSLVLACYRGGFGCHSTNSHIVIIIGKTVDVFLKKGNTCLLQIQNQHICNKG